MEKKLTDLIPTTGTTFDFTVEGNAIWTTGELHIYVSAKYRSWVYDALYESDTLAALEYQSLFATWKNKYADSVKRAFAAFNSTYNPLENYDRYEDGTETHTKTESGTDTIEKHKGTKTSTGEEVVTTPRSQSKVTEYKLPFDSGTETETGATVAEGVSGTDTVSRDATKNFVTQSDIDGTTFDKDVHTFEDRETSDELSFNGRRTHGNIGVTTTMALINEELELRKKNLVFDYMELFIKEFAYSCEGVD